MNDTQTQNLKQMTLDGFQVVNSSLFSTLGSPAMSVWYDSVSFSQMAYQALGNCDCVTIRVNNQMKAVLVEPASSGSNTAVRWKKGEKVVKYSKISCSTFTRQIYDDWGLDPKARYKSYGRIVQIDKKVMILFEFATAEKWYGDKVAK